MNPIQVDVQIDDEFADKVSASELVRVATRTLERELVSGPTHVAISVTDDQTLHDLNRTHLGEDKVTDVLSFGSSDQASRGVVEPDTFPGQGDSPPSLGDVVISYPQAARQAEAAGHPAARELALLAAHGVLHLLGFDHVSIKDERDMFARQDAVLEELLGALPDRKRA